MSPITSQLPPPTFRWVVLVSLICTIFVSYPNLLFLSWDWNCVPAEGHTCYIDNMLMRFLLFWAFSVGALLYNQRWLKKEHLQERILPNLVLTIVAYGLYKGITALICTGFDGRPIILTFQFIVMGMMWLLLGFTNYLSIIHQKKEEELQQLKIESLESRCTALTNQINPHFFFNSLGGISSLVRKKDDKLTICYIDHLSDIFRYILQSERKGLVTLEEELDFARSFSEVMEVRYAGKLDVHIDVPADSLNLSIPVLALLPLIENVTVHNMIDSEHRMKVDIVMNNEKELMVINPLYPKQYKPETHGTGLSNLEKRFSLLMNRQIRVEKTDKEFKVILPLG
ncbi:MAG: histidine kinase [Bacteroidaceae bacterium]|nr:histidine kinase [Bacteroidaceae bacterium]